MSLERMTRSWQRWFGRAVSVLGLLLVAPLAYAGGVCASAMGWEAPAARTASQERCQGASAAPDACIAIPCRIDASASAAASLSPDPLPSAPAQYYAQGVVLATVPLRSSTGLDPGFPSPAYILFGRYLS
ncbi:MAG: hypothetical protein ACREUS_06665 [Burkholderiales bacterium]